ncbi:substrate-binding periplasmic protein [Chitinimonas lacunae]|uniref:Substrate-binding periplasmic protein n=1 Tax=Chitinimonas lacunae TaxID=1963018 RepID=A0ABV8MKI1_9NEIS
MWRPPTLLLSLCLALLAHQVPAATVTIRLANGEWPPYMSAKLPHYGAVSRIVSEAFASEGIQVRYEFYPWKRGLELARNGGIDGTLAWVRTDDRERDFWLSDPLFESNAVLAYRKEKPVDWQKADDLGRYLIGATIGYAYGPLFSRFEQRFPRNVERSPSDEVNLSKLMAGRIDAFVTEREVAYYLATQHYGPGVLLRFATHPKTLDSNKMYLLLSREVPQGKAFQAAFNRGLARLMAAGRVEQYLHEARQMVQTPNIPPS